MSTQEDAPEDRQADDAGAGHTDAAAGTPESHEQPADEQPSDEQESEEQDSDEQPSDEQPSDAQPSDEQDSDEQPSDEQPSDEQDSEEQGSDEQPSDAQPSDEQEPDDDPLERITERIDKARAQAEDAGVIDDTEEKHFAESGATEDEDDQTIAPPG